MSSESSLGGFTAQDIFGRLPMIEDTIGRFQMPKEMPTSPQPDETKTMSVPKAGKIFFGLGRDASYRAAKSGQMPAIWIGGKIRAVVPAIEQMLAEAGKKTKEEAV